jgi:metal-responsive CopG/Arc/MetJ family transcriptional regulator
MGQRNGPPKLRQKRLMRLQVMLEMAELRALDDFRFKKRMPSRASAIREILRRGLTADGFAVAREDAHSKEFGVIRDDSQSAAPGGTDKFIAVSESC